MRTRNRMHICLLTYPKLRTKHHISVFMLRTCSKGVINLKMSAMGLKKHINVFETTKALSAYTYGVGNSTLWVNHKGGVEPMLQVITYSNQ